MPKYSGELKDSFDTVEHFILQTVPTHQRAFFFIRGLNDILSRNDRVRVRIVEYVVHFRRKAVEQLTPTHSYDEIATILGVTKKTIYNDIAQIAKTRKNRKNRRTLRK